MIGYSWNEGDSKGKKKRGIKSCVMFYLYKCFGLKIGFKWNDNYNC